MIVCINRTGLLTNAGSSYSLWNRAVSENNRNYELEHFQKSYSGYTND